MRLLQPSTIPHPWRQTLAILVADIAYCFLLYLLFVGLDWLAVQFWTTGGWSMVPVTA